VSRGYRQFCGLAQALDLIGGRWALLIVRDLLTGPKRFSELQDGLPGVPSNVLTARLRELEDSGIVLRRAHERPGGGVVYDLTDFGRELEQPIMQLGFWGARAIGPMHEGDHFSTDSLALALRGMFRPEHADGPERLYEFKVAGKSLRACVDAGKVVVQSDSTDEPDLVVESDPDVLAGLLSGDMSLDAARKSGRLQLQGTKAEAARLLEMFRFPSST
jgi:DNA-binding HxlR family transcriptional regulator/putative sterol carrier protein